MITIGIPTLSRIEDGAGPSRLQRVLESIKNHTPLLRSGAVRVLVLDDGSVESQLALTSQVVAHMKQWIPLEMVAHKERQGIAASWNHLTRHYSDTRLMVLLNDDVEVVDHWLEVLKFSLEENKSVGVVGLNAYLSLTKAQVARIFPEHAAPHERAPRVDYNEAKLLDGGGWLLSAQGSAFAFRKDVFDCVCGFDERYFVYYEEVDYAVALRQRNLHSYMASYPIIYHMGGATNSVPENLDARAHMERSRALFEEKWGKSFAALREGFAATYVRPVLKEWNTQLENWK